jgi:hypothetical protein
MRLTLLALTLALAACGSNGSANLTADIDGADFGGRLSVYHGGRHILIIDRAYDCRDIGWVRQNYFSTERPASSRLPFVALQLTFDGFDGEINLGSFSLEGQGAPATGWLVRNPQPPASGDPPPVQAERSRTGSRLVVNEMSDDAVEGNFELFFQAGTATGSFESVPCRNLRQ